MSSEPESGEKICNWQGYGFGAPYEDAGCCNGEIADLDDCDEPGDRLGLRGEMCPQCDGTGKYKTAVGPMALIRQRALAESLGLCEDVRDADLRELLKKQFRGWHQLVNKLEAPKVTSTPAEYGSRLKAEGPRLSLEDEP